ncbi:site-specific DNA-methyltransferase [Marinilabilia salmonicolor]|uniref:site-specific DNA-methyltransferase n=1 Tax=Marinilabilia salmonicolor TaxID=989 RepID=UPI000DF1B8E2|nr:DNA methyltransferase [Marinilabilia salmonicolor]
MPLSYSFRILTIWLSVNLDFFITFFDCSKLIICLILSCPFFGEGYKGSIWINIDEHEYAYLKVLCDEIFKSENFVGSVIWQHSIQGKGYEGKFSLHHNYILCYKKSDAFELGQLERTEEHNVNYKNPDNDPNGRWRAGDIRNALYRKNLIYDIETPSGGIIKPPTNGWRFSKETMFEKMKIGQVSFSEDESRLIYKIYLKDQEGRVPETVWFGKEVGTTRDANNELKALFGEKLFDTPKPEKLLKRILHIASKENDIVLDFFMGSATTQAVSLKMKRRFIGIEQMDYINSVSVERLKKVIGKTEKQDGELLESIDFDNGGISREVNWHGGGSFIYCELAKQNQTYADQILEADSNEKMIAVWQQMKEKAFLSYQFDKQKFDERIEAFKTLSLDDQKKFLLEVLDKNQLYVNFSEMADETYGISEADKKINKQFYKIL